MRLEPQSTLNLSETLATHAIEDVEERFGHVFTESQWEPLMELLMGEFESVLAVIDWPHPSGGSASLE